MRNILKSAINWLLIIILIPSIVGCDMDLFGQNRITEITLSSDTAVIDVDEADNEYVTITASATTKGGAKVAPSPKWIYDEDVFTAVGTPTSTLRLRLNMDGTGPNGKDITGYSVIKAVDTSDSSVFDEIVINVTGALQAIWFQDDDGNRITSVTLDQKETHTYDIGTYPRAAQGFELIGEADPDNLDVASVSVDSLNKTATISSGYPGTAKIRVATADGRFETALTVEVTELEIPETTASRILIDQGNYMSLAPSAEEIRLSATVYDQYNQEIDGIPVTWSSSDPATVSFTEDNGGVKITANKVGRATITASVTDSPLSAEMLVEVGNALSDIIITPYDPPMVMARALFSIVEEEDAQLSSQFPIGKTAYYRASYLPSNTDDTGVKWSVDNPDVVEIASVDGDIVEISAISAGTANLIATSTVNPDIASYVTVSVYDPYVDPDLSISQIVLDPVALQLEEGESEYITAKALFHDGSEGVTDIIWSTDGSAVEIAYTSPDTSEIEVVAAAPGIATVTATALSNPNLSSSATILVYAEGQEPGKVLQKIVPSPASLNMIIGRSATVDLSYLPPDALTGILQPVVSSDIIKVSSYDDESVTIEALEAGNAYVTLSSSSDNSITARINVHVMTAEEAQRPSRISLSANTLELGINDTETVDADVYLMDGSIYNGFEMTWTLERGDSIVEMTPSGNSVRIMGVAEGDATVIASLKDYPEISSRIELIVYESGVIGDTELKRIIPDQESITIVKGGSSEVGISYLPPDAVKGIMQPVVSSDIIRISAYDDDSVTIEALETGSAHVTLVSSSDIDVEAKINVRVISEEEQDTQPARIVLSSNTLSLDINETGTVSADVYLANGSISDDLTVSWIVQSGSSSIETEVSGNTISVKGISSGEATIVASVEGYPDLRSSVEVIVSSEEAFIRELRKIVPAQDSITLMEGTTSEIGISYLPSNTTEKGVIWTISDGSIAYVEGDDDSVTIEAIKPGSTTVKATSVANPSITASIGVRILSEEEAYLPATINLYPASLNLHVSSRETIVARVYNAIGTEILDPSISWQVIGGNEYIEISAAGNEAAVTALAEGVSTVRASVTGSSVYADVEIIVSGDESDPTVALQSIVLSSGSLTIIEGESVELNASYIPGNTYQKGIVWSSSSDAISVAGNGESATITGRSITTGSEYVTATSSVNPEISARAMVRVVSEEEAARIVSRIEFTPSVLEVSTPYPINEIQITAQSYDNADNILSDSYSWQVSQTSDVISLRRGEDGTSWITVNGPGRATIIATSQLNPAINASLTVIVGGELESISVTPSSVRVYRNGKATLRASLNPSDTLETDLTWQVISDDGVERVRISQNADKMTATITGLEAGRTTVKVSSTAHPDISATCQIEVLAQEIPDGTMPSSITISPSSITIAPPFETAVVNAVVYGSNGTIYPIGVDWVFENGLTVDGDDPIAVISPTGDFGVRIVPERAGEATLTATSKVDESITASVPVIIEGAIGDIEFINLNQQLVSMVVDTVTQVQVQLTTADGGQTVETDIEWYQEGFVPVYDDDGRLEGYDTDEDGSVDDDGSGMAFTLSPTQSGGIYGCSIAANTVGTYSLIVRSLVRPEVFARITVNITPAAQITGAITISPSSLALSPGDDKTLITARIETDDVYTFPEDTSITMATSPSGLLKFSSPLWDQDGMTYTMYASPGDDPGEGYITVSLPDYPGIKAARGRVSIGGALTGFEPYNPEGDDDILIISKGDTVAIGVDYVPSNTMETGVVWRSANDDIVSVVSSADSNRAILSAVGVGTTTVTAESAVHPGISGIRYTYTVTVKPVIESVSFSSRSSSGSTSKGLTFNVVAGETLDLECDIFPEILNDTTQLLITPHTDIAGSDDDAPTLRLINGTLNDYTFIPAEGTLGSYQYDIIQQSEGGLRGDVIDVLTVNVIAESTSLNIYDSSGFEEITDGDFEYVFSTNNSESEFTAAILDNELQTISNVEWRSSNPQIARAIDNGDGTVTVQMRYPDNWNKCAGECIIKGSVGNGGAVIEYDIHVYIGLEIPDSLYQALAKLSPFKDDSLFMNYKLLLPDMTKGITDLNFANLRIEGDVPIEINNGTTCYLSEDYFPDLTYLNLSNCILSSTNLSLKGCSKLETLIIEQPSSNAAFQLDSISNVPTSLKEVNVDYNLLSSISSFNGLGSLKTLSIEYNQLTSFRDGSMQNSIENIYLNGNILLESVSLSKPNLNVVEINNCPVLSSLDVSSSGIKSISAYNCILSDVEITSSCISLEYLDLHNNKLGGSAVGSGKSVLTIGDWEVIGYQWTKLPDNSSGTKLVAYAHKTYKWGLPKLDYLNLTNNGIYYYWEGKDEVGTDLGLIVRIGNGIDSEFTIFDGYAKDTGQGEFYYDNNYCTSFPWNKNKNKKPIKMKNIEEGEVYTFALDFKTYGWWEDNRNIWVKPFG